MHDPFEIKVFANWVVILTVFFEAVVLVEANGTIVLAEDAEIEVFQAGEFQLTHRP